MPTPFFIILKKKHTVPKVTSFTDTPEAMELQLLVDADHKAQYRKKEAEFRHQGHNFRLTKGIVYEIKDMGETIDVAIALQIKGHSLTWYFWVEGGMDQYPQSFRDKLYNAAARAHKEVDNGCDLYYRGSNAVHIKLMHHIESESDHNHNHYRLKDNKPYTPEDFEQHMRALAKDEIHDEFFEEGEITSVCDKFAEFHMRWTTKSQSGMSLEDEYFQQPSQRLDKEDIIELDLFGPKQEPCRINTSELKVDFEKARKKIEDSVRAGTPIDREGLLQQIEQEYKDLLEYRLIGGSRGLHSAIASSRQVPGSKNPVIKANMGMDDALKKEVPDIPTWATSLIDAVEVAKANMLQAAKTRLEPEKTPEGPQVSVAAFEGTLLNTLEKENKENKATAEGKQIIGTNGIVELKS